MASKDFTSDSFSDLLFYNQNTRALATWDYGPSGTVAYKTVGTVPALFSVTGTGDVDGDGNLDILFNKENPTFPFLLPPLAGTFFSFDEVHAWRLESGTYDSNIPLGSYQDYGELDVLGALVRSARIVVPTDEADFDGDGRSDTVILSGNVPFEGGPISNDQITIYTASGIELPPLLGSVAVDGYTIQGVADFTGEGTSDILWRNDTSGAVVLWRFTNGQPQSTGFGTVGQEWQIETLGDFDGNGSADIMWRHTGETSANGQQGDLLAWLFNEGEVVELRKVGNVDLSWTVEGSGDYTGDGSDDLLFRQTDQGGNPTLIAAWDFEGGNVAQYLNLGYVAQEWTLA